MRLMQRVLTYLPPKLLRKVFMSCNYDCEISFLEGNMCKLISSASANVKKIAWIHTDVVEMEKTGTGFINREKERDCYNSFDRIVCVSNDARKAFETKLQIYKKVFTIYNGVNKEEIIRLSNIGEKFLVNESYFKVCGVGRLSKEKRFDRLINATVKLHNEGYNIFTYIIGEGRLHTSLQELIDSSNAGNYVKLLGFHDNPYCLMSQADCYVCSSEIEGFSLTVAEALVLGIPVLATKCSGPCELLDNGKYGVLVENDVKSIYLGLKQNFFDLNKIDKYKDMSKERAEFFNMSKTLSALIQLIND